MSTFGRCPAPADARACDPISRPFLRHRPCFGLIPAGSTNTIVWSVNGNACLTTCALRVILGESTNMDIGAVHRTGKPIVYMTNFLGYGFFGDVMKHSEGYGPSSPALSNLSPARSAIACASELAALRLYGAGAGGLFCRHGVFPVMPPLPQHQTPQHHNIATSQHPDTPTPQYPDRARHFPALMLPPCNSLLTARLPPHTPRTRAPVLDTGGWGPCGTG